MKLLLYCTKAKKQKDLLWSNNLKHFFLDGAYNRLIDDLPNYLLNGKIVAECDFEVEEIKFFTNSLLCERDYVYYTETTCCREIRVRSCLKYEELADYLGTAEDDTKVGYAIHIKNLHIFDKPRELSKYHISYFNKELEMMREKHVEKAPQNMCRVFNENGNYILISIRPEWLCKILNGEKTIEIRKKVLKEMLK